jgi:hypothetical protein
VPEGHEALVRLGPRQKTLAPERRRDSRGFRGRDAPHVKSWGDEARVRGPQLG